jgi:hypothetical protein
MHNFFELLKGFLKFLYKMGVALTKLRSFKNTAEHKPNKIPLLHRPTSLSNTYDEMTEAVRHVDKCEAGEKMTPCIAAQ